MAPEVKTAKNSKLPKLSENCFELVGKGGWPPISILINPTSLGRNGIHFIEFPGERGKQSNLVHCLPCWRRCIVEGCHELVVGRVESVQPVGLHEMSGCRRNIFNLLYSYKPASIR